MAYIRTEEVAEIRKALKANYGKKFKFSVTRRDRGLAVVVSIMAGKTDFSDLWADKVPGDYGYGYKDVNCYHIKPEYYGKHTKLFEDIVKIIKTAPANAEGGRAWFDKSDAMTDYFHTAFYFDLHVGRWDRAYERKAA
jgi:hypothetical protein